ncbi:MAG TPA: hypothetical protein VJB05_00310 [archaeon]|nr:hypothetical protein [archaeon]
MKGLELPINMIVVVAIAVLVLVVVAAFFAGQLGGGTSTIALENAFISGCGKLKSLYNCDSTQIGSINVLNYAPQGTPVSATGFPFSSICTAKGYITTQECAKACGCQI